MKSRFFHTTANRCQKPRPIRLTGLNFDKRAAYVDSVCTLLNESRFGPMYSLFDRPSKRPADEPVSLLDLIEQECVSWFEVDSGQNRLRQRPANTRAADNLADASHARTSTQHPLGRAPTLAFFPPTLGRGSPKSSGTHFLPLASSLRFGGLAGEKEKNFNAKPQRKAKNLKPRFRNGIFVRKNNFSFSSAHSASYSAASSLK